MDWLNARLYIRRAIVRQRVGETKTEFSNRPLAIGPQMLEALKVWRQATQFSDPEDWMFATPVKLGRLPWSADAINDAYLKACKGAEIVTDEMEQAASKVSRLAARRHVNSMYWLASY